MNKTTSAADTADKCQRKCSGVNSNCSISDFAFSSKLSFSRSTFQEGTLSRIKRYAEDGDEMAVIETTLRRSIEFQ